MHTILPLHYSTTILRLPDSRLFVAISRTPPEASGETMSSFLLFCIAQVPATVSQLYLDPHGELIK